MQTEIKIWEDEVYKKGMTSDRVIRSIAYRILPLHEFIVKDFLEQLHYFIFLTESMTNSGINQKLFY